MSKRPRKLPGSEPVYRLELTEAEMRSMRRFVRKAMEHDYWATVDWYESDMVLSVYIEIRRKLNGRE